MHTSVQVPLSYNNQVKAVFDKCITMYLLNNGNVRLLHDFTPFIIANFIRFCALDSIGPRIYITPDLDRN